jgi:hypothetical protein
MFGYLPFGVALFGEDGATAGGGGPASYSLTAALGTFSYTGQPAGMTVGRNMQADVGIFSYAGQTAGLPLTTAYTLVAGQATFSYSGQPATLTWIRSLVAGQATFSRSRPGWGRSATPGNLQE